MKLDMYSNDMLYNAQVSCELLIEKTQELLETHEKDLQVIQDEIARRLKIEINNTIRKVQEAGDQAYV